MPNAAIATNSFLKIARLSPTARVPTRGSKLAAGYDIYASEPLIIDPHGRGVVRTGIKIAIPENTYGRVAPRSGLAVKKGIDVAAGVIDADYRGELMVALFNHGDEDFEIQTGDRIAQLILERIFTPQIEEVTDDLLDATERGTNGFGSTGGFQA